MATRLTENEAAHARAVAFAVAQATRDGDDHALDALAALLTGASAISAFDDGTLVNIMSALQFASMLPEDVRAGWSPPEDTVPRTVELGLMSGEALRAQADGLLWAVVSTRLVADWLGSDIVKVASRVTSSELREALLDQLRTHEGVISLVEDGHEFPCVPA